MNKKLIEFRQLLHKNPELSGNEYNTKQKIIEYLTPLDPDEILEFGKTGVAFLFKGGIDGPRVMFRADIDALPIYEESDLAYRSVVSGVGHLCGHDGHSTILCGLAERIAENRPKDGEVILLFQPAEETGQGAFEMINTPEFVNRWPDYIFGLHNIPGYPLNSVLLREGAFAASSRGMIIKLKGKTSHAAEPDKGISPVKAVSKIIQHFDDLQQLVSVFSDFVLCTVIHIRMGERAFGTTPGEAEVMVTLRSFEEEDMQRIVNESEKVIARLALEHNLLHHISYTEIFPATENNKQCVTWLNEAALANTLDVVELKEPFRWSEDFGYYTKDIKAGFFGLGAGEEHPALHNPHYDFPDEIIETGINMFYSLYKKILHT
jgi:amidohydrolase